LKDSAYATPNAPASAVAAKLAEARAIFEAITQQQFAARAEAANASWRAGQCRREESLVTLTAARAVPFKPGVKPEEIAAATKSIEDSLAALRQAAASLKTEAAKRAVPADKGAQASPESCARMLYEAAWCCRVLADAEIEVARQKLQTQALEKVTANLKKAAPDQAPPLLTPPDLPLSAVPVQPGEKAAQDCYNALIAAAPRSALAPRARLELAELLSQRDQNDKALELLASALEDTPPADLVERIHVRIAACLLAKGDAKTALARTQQVLKNQASPVAPEARYLEGEAHILNKDWANAITQLVFFRDQGPYQNIPGVSDRALLRLGYAFAQAKRWDESRQAYDALCGRFNQSPLFGEARFGIGWAWQNQNQHDNACNAYAEVTRRTAAEVAARAQLQIGLCRLAQKRFPDAAKELLAVPFTYGYPEHSAAALCEAGQAYLEQKKPDESRKVWDDVVKNYPGSQWAETARQRLAALK
jgi:TolA-binding protein